MKLGLLHFYSEQKRVKLIALIMLMFSCMPIYITGYAADDAILKNNIVETDKKLSFYFQNIDIRSLLQLLAKQAKANFIISDAVKGSMTLNLKDVTWDQAFKIILK